jgi:hypothetical protein
LSAVSWFASVVLKEAGLASGDFLCECGIEDCEQTVALSLGEYVSLDGNCSRLIAHDERHETMRAPRLII